MVLTSRWPQLADLVTHANEIGELELWAFGSMLTASDPQDLDVAVIYEDRRKLVELRNRMPWELTNPPIDLIALTPDEDSDLTFLHGVEAVLLDGSF